MLDRNRVDTQQRVTIEVKFMLEGHQYRGRMSSIFAGKAVIKAYGKGTYGGFRDVAI